MTSINLQFMLFFKPLSVHSRSIMWRPDGREKKRGGRKGGRKGGREGDTEKESCYMPQSILAVQEDVIELG